MKSTKQELKKLLTVCAILALTSTSCGFVPEEEEVSMNIGERQLVWSDEFDYSGVPATSKWKYQTGKSGWATMSFRIIPTTQRWQIQQSLRTAV